jgi:uncharacterized membrane protein YgaE (UPF0421/DUF939 family)
MVTSARELLRGARRRLAAAGWTVVQTPLAAGLAWYIAHTLLGHHQPFFAPIAAALSLSANRVLRGQRALQLIAGVLLGIGIGTAVKAVAGPVDGTGAGALGAVAIGVATLLALVAALVLGAGFFEQGVLFINQSASSAVLMIAVAGAATSAERLFDALIGGGCTILFAAVLFPAAPLSIIARAAQQVYATLRDALDRVYQLAAAGQTADPQWVLATGQRIHAQLAALQLATSTARQVAWIAPRRWPERSRVRQATERSAPLHLLAGTVLSLVHASASTPESELPLPPALTESLRHLTAALAAQAVPARATPAPPGPAPPGPAASADAARARSLAAAAVGQAGPHAQLVARLVQSAADDIALLAT